MVKVQSPVKAIRSKCLDCVGFILKEVRNCPITDCSLWPYRMGHNPSRKGKGGFTEPKGGRHTDDSFVKRCYSMLDNSFKKKGYKPPEDFESIVGMSAEDFKDYLLETWKEIYGYEWDMAELAHIDHIIPLVTAKSYEDTVKLNHYTNLRLIRAEDNLAKGTKLDYQFEWERREEED